MTPLKPLPSRNVLGVPSTTYPSNTICSHPGCAEPAADQHHCFPRSQIIGDSWFVSLGANGQSDMPDPRETGDWINWSEPIPHVTGLCRAHHEAVETHRAWIKLEDGEFRWYYRVLEGMEGEGWVLDGPLNPQPGSREGKPKKRKKPATLEPAKPKQVYAIRVPKEEMENGHAVLTELVDLARHRLAPQMGWSDTVAAYHVHVAVLVDWLSR